MTLSACGNPSHSARSAWIETSISEVPGFQEHRRTPQGVRGLKQVNVVLASGRFRSHSARSAWIETVQSGATEKQALGRTPQGVRGLKQQGREVDSLELVVALRKECVD